MDANYHGKQQRHRVKDRITCLDGPRTSSLVCFGVLVFSLVWSNPVISSSLDGTMSPVNLRCEYLLDPLGIDSAEPRLSWTFEPGARGLKQSAYQIQVASILGLLDEDKPDLWDTGIVQSSNSILIPYMGVPLQSRAACQWRVRVWDQSNRPSEWSEPAFWSMGLFQNSDWKASWIGAPIPEPYDDKVALPAQRVRTEIFLPNKVKRATAYVTARGVYEFHINGKRVGDAYLAPEWTDYNRRIQYQTYDVLPLLREGGNAMAAEIGDGWYAGRLGIAHAIPEPKVRGFYGKRPRFLMQLEVETESGETKTFVTDDSWTVSEDGPIRSSDMLDGEVFDARRDADPWKNPGFQGWGPVVVEPLDGTPLVAQMNEPIRVIEELHPASISEPSPGVYIVDMGQNMVGWCRIQVEEPAGTEIRFRHNEVLNPDGTLYRENLRMPADGGPWGARQENKYICAGNGKETFEPHFTFHGFRYLEIVGVSRKPRIDDIVGRVLCSGFPETATFECSSPLLNQLSRNILWGQRGNMLGVPTDCPQRDERLGWMGDIQVFAPAACFNAAMGPFLTKFSRDMRDAQADDGRFPDFAPNPFDSNRCFSGVPAWGDAGVIVPWVAYQRYGDRRILAEHFDAAKAWVDFIHRNNPDLLWKNSRGNDYGDWLNGDTLIQEGWPKEGGQVPKDIFATLYFARSTRIVTEMASILGRTEEMRKYGALGDAIETAFQNAYLSEDGMIPGETQSGYALALHFGLVPSEIEKKVQERMVQAVEKYNRHISTGFLSTIALMHELTRFGANDIAYQLINNKTFPSWGYTIEQGATTMWERWDGYVAGRGFQDPGMNSFNHYAFGSVGDWMWKTIVGINPETPGFERIRIQPRIGGGLMFARGEYDSIRGKIAVSWKTEGDSLYLDVTIPPNTTAVVHVPSIKGTHIQESGKPATKAEGLKRIRREGDTAVFEAGSGTYQFTSKLPQ